MTSSVPSFTNTSVLLSRRSTINCRYFLSRAFAARNTERGGGALSDLYFRGKAFLLLRYYISLFAVVYTSLPLENL